MDSGPVRCFFGRLVNPGVEQAQWRINNAILPDAIQLHAGNSWFSEVQLHWLHMQVLAALSDQNLTWFEYAVSA